MARKKKTTTVEELVPDAEQDVFAPEDDMLARAAEDLGANLSVIKIYAIPKTGKPEFLTEFASDDTDSIVAEVARRFGGGHYLARFYGDDGLIQRAPVRFNVAAVVKPQVDEDGEPLAGSDDFKGRILEKLLAKAIDGGGGANPAAITAAIVQSATAQSAAMMQLIMPMIQQMMTNAKPRELPVEVMSEMLQAGIELASAKDEATPMGLVERFAGIVERIQRKDERRPGRPDVDVPAVPVVRVGDAVAAVGGSGAGSEGVAPGAAVKAPGWLKVLRPYVDDLLVAAKDDVPPSLVAATIIDRSPATADWLVAQPATFVESLLDAVPELKPYDAWVRGVFAALREEDDDTPPGPSLVPDEEVTE